MPSRGTEPHDRRLLDKQLHQVGDRDASGMPRKENLREAQCVRDGVHPVEKMY